MQFTTQTRFIFEDQSYSSNHFTNEFISRPTKPIRKKVIPIENQECFYCKAKSSNTWRKGPDGSKSLCNACGLRYYRLLLKEKNLVPTSTPNPIHSILN